ncbi:MAG: hypothetical protein R3362_11845 [Rhodothermales bacterium]|nr:hypothetical protein [Rhodothermales bacterium]
MRTPAALLVLALALTLAFPAQADPPLPTPPAPDATEAQWAAFGENLVVALQDGNDGVKAGAMQMIIHYGDRLDCRAAQFDVIRIYRSHPDERMRRLAIVTAGALQSGWAMGFLRMSEPFEKSDILKKTIQAVVHEDALRAQAVVR